MIVGVGSCPSRPPKYHRPEQKTCAPPSAPAACLVDADCTVVTMLGLVFATQKGKCVDGGAGGTCDYDECHADSECLSGTDVCVCANEIDVMPPSVGAECVAGTCRTDSACGNGLYCSPSISGYCGASYIAGQFCHTCQDECVDDADCQLFERCSYDPAVGHWACRTTPCAG